MLRSDTFCREQPSALHRLVSLPLVGGFVALGAAGTPLLVLLAVEPLLFGRADQGPAFGIVASLLTAGWLVYLERRQRVRLMLPVFRVPLLWLMPVYLLANVAALSFD